MMLSTTAAYALRAVIYLATREGQGPVRVEDVADALGVPRNYLSKVLHALVKEGLLQSLRGPHGGFELAVPASSVTLYQVVRAFDGVEGQQRCLLGRVECDAEKPCAVHDRWSGVASEVESFFRDTVLVEVLGDLAPVKRAARP